MCEIIFFILLNEYHNLYSLECWTVDWSATSIRWQRVRIPSKPSMLFFIIWSVLLFAVDVRKWSNLKIKLKDAVVLTWLLSESQTTFWCKNWRLRRDSNLDYRSKTSVWPDWAVFDWFVWHTKVAQIFVDFWGYLKTYDFKYKLCWLLFGQLSWKIGLLFHKTSGHTE